MYGFLEVNKVRSGFCCEPDGDDCEKVVLGHSSPFPAFGVYSTLRTSGLSKVLVPVRGFNRGVEKSCGKVWALLYGLSGSMLAGEAWLFLPSS